MKSRPTIKGILLHNGQEIEAFISGNGGTWPVRGYVNTRRITYRRKRDGGETVRYVHSIFVTVYKGYADIAIREGEDTTSSTDGLTDLSTYTSEELGYF